MSAPGTLVKPQKALKGTPSETLSYFARNPIIQENAVDHTWSPYVSQLILLTFGGVLEDLKTCFGQELTGTLST